MWKYFTHMKTRKYIDVLPNFLYAYNHAYHSSIKMTPTQALDNEREARRNLYAGKPKEQQTPKLAVGDNVRISREKALFEKGFEQNWSREIFKIVDVLRKERVVYKLEDLLGEPIEGTFYEIELQKVKLPEKYAIEKILKKKGN